MSHYARPMGKGLWAFLGVFVPSIAVTVGAAGVVGWFMGAFALWQVINLIILEVTFSFDNAVVNAKYLKTMSPFWQTIFMTVGILIAVFVVRFSLPIFIVMMTTGQSFGHVIDLALNNPLVYAEELHTAGPLIDSFGGVFLVMIGLSYFMDDEKDSHWLHPIERRLAPLGRFDNIVILVMIAFSVAAYALYTQSVGVLVAGIAGVLLYMLLDLFDAAFGGEEDASEAEETKSGVDPKLIQKTGLAAFVVFMRLEILDASFSFDGVIGAFALTTSVLIIAAGLGAGAMWVRSLTVYLVRSGALSNYRYLEHGAHWAILILGMTMLIKLFHIELPEAVIGSIGLVFVAWAVWSSVRANKRDAHEGLEKLKQAVKDDPWPLGQHHADVS